MSQLKPQRFTVEQFQSQSEWIGDFFSSLNQFTNDVWVAFNNQLTIKDNLYQEIKEIKFVNDSANYPLRFKTKFNAFPQGMLSIYVYNNTLSSFAAVNPVFDWTYLNNEVVINSLTGLTASSTYTIRFWVIYG